MDSRFKIALRWLLVLPASVASIVAAMIAMEFSILLDRSLIASATHLALSLSPPLLLHVSHLFSMLLVALLLVLPPTFAVGFALHVGGTAILPWGFSIATLLGAIFVWFVGPGDVQTLAHWIAGTATVIVVAGVVLASLSHQRRMQVVANIVGTAVLFVPSMSALIP